MTPRVSKPTTVLPKHPYKVNTHLRPYQLNSLPRVQYVRWEPRQFHPPNAAQTSATQPQQVESTAPVGHHHQWVRGPGEVSLPVLGHVAPGGQVEGVIAPGFGYAVYGGDDPSPFRPLNAAVRITVVFHPLLREVSQPGGTLVLRVTGGAHLGSLNRYVHPFDFPSGLHPRR